MIKECDANNHKWVVFSYRKHDVWITPKNKRICSKCEKIIQLNYTQVKVEKLHQ